MNIKIDESIKNIDDRRDCVTPGDKNETVKYAVQHFIKTANDAIEDHGYFAVALSGGSTPKAIFHALAEEQNRNAIDWSRVIVFWSDERAVPPDNPDSNYHMAMESGFHSLPIPIENIFRMEAEVDPEHNAKEYEQIIIDKLNGQPIDLVMLGMGDDGHTASLFPKTHALHSPGKLVVGNYIPKFDTWRMTFTFEGINSANNIVLYVLGDNKADMVKTVFSEEYDPDTYPVQAIGTENHKALWILDNAAAKKLKEI